MYSTVLGILSQSTTSKLRRVGYRLKVMRNCLVEAEYSSLCASRTRWKCRGQILRGNWNNWQNISGFANQRFKKNLYCPALILYKKHICGLSIIGPRFVKKNCQISKLKVVGNEKVGGSQRWHMIDIGLRTVVIDVRFYFYLAAILDLILFPFPLTPAQ